MFQNKRFSYYKWLEKKGVRHHKLSLRSYLVKKESYNEE